MDLARVHFREIEMIMFSARLAADIDFAAFTRALKPHIQAIEKELDGE